MLLFSNPDCRVFLSRRSDPMPFYARYVDGDLLCFVHEGAGVFETEFGPLRYRDGDWVYLPKACTWRHVPAHSDETAQTTLLMIEAADEFRVPPPGQLGRHFPFDPSQATIPEPAPIDDDGRDEYEVRLFHVGGPTSLYYQHNPIDVEGWRGDNFPFTFNIADYNVVTSDSVHLPPTVHLFMQATGVYVMNFLPRPVEGVAGTERSPVVSPQRRLRRAALLPRRLDVRHPHAGWLDLPCAARRSPRGVRARPGTRAQTVRPGVQGRVAGHRGRHPAPVDTLTRGTGQRSGASSEMTESTATRVSHEYDRIPYLVTFQNNSGVRDAYGGVAERVVLESHLLTPKRQRRRQTRCWCSCTRPSRAGPTCPS